MVEVVRRLVQEEGLGLGEEDAGELDATALPSERVPRAWSRTLSGRPRAAAICAASALAAHPPAAVNSWSSRT